MARGEQLSLFEGGLDTVRIPWDGRSPRALTQAAMNAIFKAQAEKSVSEFVDPNQCVLWPTGQSCPPVVYRGAPLLKGV